MADTNRQHRILVLLVFVILFLSTANAIRSLAADKNHKLQAPGILTENSTDPSFPTGGLKTEQHADQDPHMNDPEETCNNVDEDEECLMRRTLVAHVDYIYTQEHNP